MKSKKLTEGILIFYVVMLVWIILFKMDVSVENFGQMRSINLVPFSQSVIVNDKLDVSEIIQNVLAFVPLGILIYTIWQEKRSGRLISVRSFRRLPITESGESERLCSLTVRWLPELLPTRFIRAVLKSRSIQRRNTAAGDLPGHAPPG